MLTTTKEQKTRTSKRGERESDTGLESELLEIVERKSSLDKSMRLTPSKFDSSERAYRTYDVS